MIVRYGVYHQGIGKNGSIEVPEDVTDERVHDYVMKKILEKHPGWMVTGYYRQSRGGQLPEAF